MGYEIIIVSLNGGKVEFDGFSDLRDVSGYFVSDLVSLGFIYMLSLIG